MGKSLNDKSEIGSLTDALSIIQINTLDRVGGAAQVAWNLHCSYMKRGIDSWMAVRTKSTENSKVLEFSQFDRLYETMILKTAAKLSAMNHRFRGSCKLGSIVRRLATPSQQWANLLGYENFAFPASWSVLQQFSNTVDIVHCHNLHGGYFDLRALPQISKKIPVVLTLHDAWLLSGHCAHSLGCGRWKTGCGKCPDLDLYPAIRRDATHHNWKRKKNIYTSSRLYIASPSKWLMDKVDQSILAQGVVEARVIPNGVDLSIFSPNDRNYARSVSNIPENATVILFCAHNVQKNSWKDLELLRKMVAIVAEKMVGKELIFVSLGGDAPTEKVGRATIRYIPYNTNVSIVASYYQAADIYTHAALVDTFPNTIIEALACGTPVVATAVGGIPEQVKGLKGLQNLSDRTCLTEYGPEQATGVLVTPGDVDAMADTVIQIAQKPDLRWKISRNAAQDAINRFDLDRQVKDYLDWYREILCQWQDLSPQFS
jgi:glycosyltransferase involved in cell wall biosynthesis